MAGFVKAQGVRPRWINPDVITELDVVFLRNSTLKEKGEWALKISYIDGSARHLNAEAARDFLIALGLADVVSDGDGHPQKLVTPFGEKSLL